MIIPLLLFATLNLAHCSCPPGLDLISGGECRGRISIIKSGQKHYGEMSGEAVAQCGAIGAQPVIIHDAEQNAYWTTYASNNTNNMRIVLGLVCSPDTLHWEWADGTRLDFFPDDKTAMKDLISTCYPTCSFLMNKNAEWEIMCNSQENSFTRPADVDVSCTKKLQQPTDNGCDADENGVCYQMIPAADNMRDALIKCGDLGANLVSVHSAQENSFLRRLAVSSGAVSGVVLGGISSASNEMFAWTDGTEWDYQNFAPAIMPDFSPSGPWREGQVISTPGYPFDSSTPCDFILTVAEGKSVQVEILLLEANSCCDRLIITDSLIGGNILANITGEASGKTFTTASSNLMRVTWKPNGGVNVRGLMMTFRGV